MELVEALSKAQQVLSSVVLNDKYEDQLKIVQVLKLDDAKVTFP